MIDDQPIANVERGKGALCLQVKTILRYVATPTANALPTTVAGGGVNTENSSPWMQVANTNYKLRVSGFNGASGNFVLNSFYVNPSNDDCPSALAYTAGTTISGCMGGASNDGTATCGACI